jgi:hypothetical protein
LHYPDTEFWAALAVFVEKYNTAQKALLAERKEREEREARRRCVRMCTTICLQEAGSTHACRLRHYLVCVWWMLVA